MGIRLRLRRYNLFQISTIHPSLDHFYTEFLFHEQGITITTPASLTVTLVCHFLLVPVTYGSGSARFRTISMLHISLLHHAPIPSQATPVVTPPLPSLTNKLNHRNREYTHRALTIPTRAMWNPPSLSRACRIMARKSSRATRKTQALAEIPSKYAVATWLS